MTRNLAPVVVFAYNRPVHLQRTLDALAACRLADACEVHAFADGPRTEAAAPAVADVRAVLAHEATRGRFAGFHVDAADAARAFVDVDRPDGGIATLPAHEPHTGLHDGEEEDVEQDDEDDAPYEEDDIDHGPSS